jgi:hypothetical protein
MSTGRMTTAASAAGIAGGLIIALAGCGQSGHDAGAATPSSAAPKPTSAATASPAPTPVASASGSATGVDSSIEVYADCTSPSFEPTAITVTCADAGWSLNDLAWSSWTSTSAIGTGTLVYNDCKPSCAAGHFHRVPGTRVVLTDPQPTASGQLVWTRMQETPWIPGYVTGPMHGKPYPLPTKSI